MDKKEVSKEVSEGKISKNFIFFDFRDFSFHNYGQMFPKDKRHIAEVDNAKAGDTSLNCSPDTDAAIQDALEEIIRDLSSEEIEESHIKLFNDANNNFKKFTSWLSKCKKIEEYEKYIKKNIKNFASKKHKESDGLCNKVFESLFNPVNFQQFQENIKERMTDFLKKEGISADDSNEKKYLLKYLNVLLKTIPQPWDALASGAILTFIMKLAQDNNVIGEQDNNVSDEQGNNKNVIEYEHPAIYIKDMWKCIKEMSESKSSENTLPSEYTDIVKDIQFYLEYALIINAPYEWRPTDHKTDVEPLQVSMIVFPLLDNGFFRGYFYLLSSCPDQIKAQWNNRNIMKQYEEKCLYFVDSLRVAHETEMMDVLFREKKGGDEGKENKEEDIYKKILKNLHYIQEVSLGSLWMIDGNKKTQSYVTGYGRFFKEKPKEDSTPGIYWYREYKDYENFIETKCDTSNSIDENIKKEEEDRANSAKNQYRKDRKDFYREYPKFEVLDDVFNSQHIPASSGSYYKQETLGIKWRLTLPVVRGDDLKAIYFFYYRDPIVTSNGRYTKLSKIEENILQKEVFGLRARQIMKFFSAIEAYEERKNEIIKHGTRAAVAAIDVRNLSHNLASHVLSYWGNVFDNINHKKLMQEEYNREGKYGKEEEIKKETEELQKKFSEGSGPLFAYIRKRMDFIADLITTVPSWEKTFLLKQDIVDIFTKQTVLLDNIVKSEGFCYAKDCKKKIESSGYKWPDCIKEGSRCPKLSEEKIEKDDQPEPFEIKFIPEGQDFYVSIPHGNIGIHAFYSILENFIRNSAKHGGKTIRDQIKKNRTYKDSLKITISAKDIGDYLEVTINDNVGNCKYAVNEIKKGFPPDEESHFANNDGSIKKGRWGIKEMRLSANFLRKRQVEAIEDSDRDIEKHPILSISCEYCDEKFDAVCNSNINYKLYLRKPKEVFIVKDNVENISEYQNLKNIGICVDTLNNIKKDLQQGNSIPHRFLLFDLSSGHEEILKLVESYRTKLPFRIIINYNTVVPNQQKDLWRKPVYANLNIDYHFLNSNWESHIKELYKKFVENKIGNRKILIRVEDERLPLWNNHSICEVKNTIDSCDYEKIIFDDHFYGKNKLGNYNCFYLGLSGSINPILHNLIMNPPSSERLKECGKKEIFLQELIEAAMVKVLIADERIWKNAQLKVYGRTKLKFLEKMNIDCIKIEGRTMKIDDLVNKKGYAVLVIHHGIIEKMSHEDKNKFAKWYKENCPYVVVDSGRGVPPELLDEARFIHISALEQFIDEMDKYALVQTIFSLRRPKDEQEINSRDKL